MTHPDTCWQILDIEPIRDKKSIKKAYAKKLKVTRPDADPEGFKRLNTAYQECLEYLDYEWYWEEYDEDEDDDWEEQLETIERENISISSETHHDDDMLVSATYEGGIADEGITEVSLDSVSEHMNESLKPTPIAVASNSPETIHTERTEDSQTVNLTPIATPNQTTPSDLTDNDTEDTEETRLDGEFDMEALLKPFADARVEQDVYVDTSSEQQDFINALNEIFSNPAQLDNIDTWHDLLQSDALYDIGFKQHVSMDVLGRILDMRSEQITQSEENKSKLPPSFLSQPLLVKLSDFFGWMHNQERLENQFYYQYDSLNQFYDDLEADSAPVIRQDHEVSQTEHRAHQLGLASLHLRFFAFLVDVGVLAGVIFLATQASIWLGFELTVMWLVFALVMVIAWFQAKSKYQASLGLWLFKLKMVDLHNNPVPMVNAACRFVVAVLILVLGIVSLKGIFGFVIWGAYFIEKYRSKSRFTWIDKQSKTYIINR